MKLFFHDLIHIILVHLDDLTTWSPKQTQHIDDLQQVFLRCRKYKIHLNPLKCIFFVPASHLLRFIISHKGIMVDPSNFRLSLTSLHQKLGTNYRASKARPTSFTALYQSTQQKLTDSFTCSAQKSPLFGTSKHKNHSMHWNNPWLPHHYSQH